MTQDKAIDTWDVELMLVMKLDRGLQVFGQTARRLDGFGSKFTDYSNAFGWSGLMARPCETV